MKRNKKLNKYERTAIRKKILEHKLSGKGEYIYRNNTKGTLDLPKDSLDGVKRVPLNGEWRGDDYFMHLVKKNEARLVRTISQENKENNMNEKLIVDQPDTVTTEGTVEQVVVEKSKEVLAEGNPSDTVKTNEDVLLTEDPVDGIEIIID